MANNSKKTVYIVVGITLLIFAIPALLLILGVIGGFFYYQWGAN